MDKENPEEKSKEENKINDKSDKAKEDNANDDAQPNLEKDTIQDEQGPQKAEASEEKKRSIQRRRENIR